MLHVVCLSVCMSVHVLGTRLSCAKAVIPIKMPFGGADYAGSKEPCIRCGSRSDESICSSEG